MNMSGLFSKKIGPVPVIYIAAGFVAILAVVAWRMKTTPDNTGDPVVDAGDAATDDPYDAFETTGTVIAAPSSTVTPPPTIDTNEQWARAGAEYLLSKKMTSAGNALIVMTKYVNGATLSYEEGEMRDAVISAIGYPPEPLENTSAVLAHTARKQFTAFPGQHRVTGPADNSLSKIAALYYGTTGGRPMVSLAADNPTLGPGTLTVGTIVTVKAVPGYSGTITGSAAPRPEGRPSAPTGSSNR